MYFVIYKMDNYVIIKNDVLKNHSSWEITLKYA